MFKEGEIVIIEDDSDDCDLLKDAFTELGITNKLVFFPTGEEVLQYLSDPKVFPFIIISDINLPILNGFDIRRRVFENEEISRKCLPYVFFTTSADEQSVITAYALSAQGFFTKPSGYEEVKRTIKLIVDYWGSCYAPNTFQKK